MAWFCLEVKSLADTDLSTGGFHGKRLSSRGIVQMVPDPILAHSLTIWVICRYLKQNNAFLDLNSYLQEKQLFIHLLHAGPIKYQTNQMDISKIKMNKF